MILIRGDLQGYIFENKFRVFDEKKKREKKKK